jgi:hypothetical protein
MNKAFKIVWSKTRNWNVAIKEIQALKAKVAELENKK